MPLRYAKQYKFKRKEFINKKSGEKEMLSDGTYVISDNGKRYFEYRKSKLINLLIRSIFFPIVLAAITAFYSIYLGFLFTGAF